MTQESKSEQRRITHQKLVKKKEHWEVCCTPSPGWFCLRGDTQPALCNSSDADKLQALADLLNDPDIVNIAIGTQRNAISTLVKNLTPEFRQEVRDLQPELSPYEALAGYIFVAVEEVKE